MENERLDEQLVVFGVNAAFDRRLVRLAPIVSESGVTVISAE
jgi:hypothetical protein